MSDGKIVTGICIRYVVCMYCTECFRHMRASTNLTDTKEQTLQRLFQTYVQIGFQGFTKQYTGHIPVLYRCKLIKCCISDCASKMHYKT